MTLEHESPVVVPGLDVRLDLQTFVSPSVPLWAEVAVHDPGNTQGDVHAGLEVGLVLAGAEERTFLDHGEPLLLTAGETWLASMWEPHFGRIARPATESLVAIFLPEFLGDELLGGLPWLQLFTAPSGQRPRVTTDEMRGAMLAIGGQLKREIQGQRVGWQSAVKGGLLQVLTLLRRSWKEEGDPLPRRENSLARLLPVIELVRRYPTARLSLAEAGRRCGLRPSRFSIVFRHTMGISFRQFTLNNRLGRAAHLLQTTDWPIEGIAERTEFADESHFYRAFAKCYQCTPGEYRRRFAEGA